MNSWTSWQTIEQRIEIRLNVLEHLLTSNTHIHEPELVENVMSKLRPHYKKMLKADQAYMNSAERIIAEQIPFSHKYDV